MPQEFRVLQCFDCRIYQTDIVKKAKSWSCKVCGIKQSLRTEYFHGAAAECRLKVQEMNKQQVLCAQAAGDSVISLLTSSDFEPASEIEVASAPKCEPSGMTTTTNKWSSYVADTEEPISTANAVPEQNNDCEMDKFFNFSSRQKWPLTSLATSKNCNILKRKNCATVANTSKETLNKVSKWDAFS